jgi:predicted nucleic acid-binding Zn ribbon protein
MPKPRDEAPLGALIPDVLRRLQEAHQPVQVLQEHWPRIVGRKLAGHSQPVSLRKGRLTVVVDHPGETFALNYQRVEILRRAQALTASPIEALVLRPGSLPKR